jgi:hypothetical protein
VIIPAAIATDVDTALDVISRDTTATWHLAAADVLEGAAVRIRAAVTEQLPAENAKNELEVKP